MSRRVSQPTTAEKKEVFAKDLRHAIEQYLGLGSIDPLLEYLASRSNLPGPRGNLELADVLVSVVSGTPGGTNARWWGLSEQICDRLTPDVALTNSPEEFVAFCGVRLLAAIDSASSASERRKVLARLRKHAHDPRWRVREAVAMSIQALIEKDPGTLKKLKAWIADQDWLGMRGVAAGVAEPRLMKKDGVPEQALRLHRDIMARVVTETDSARGEEFAALKKTLGYSLSVVVCGEPVEGFEYLRQLARSSNKDVVWIVRENLKKNRLISRFPKEVESIRSRLLVP